ncbi:MAG: hypothetical protein JWN46_2357 [Acidimicrobiales bacterium]|nr:hypothetical protein [Acidimicrobiales bacterium]
MRRRLIRIGPLGALAMSAVALPAVAALISAGRRPWLPASDWARIELHVREVGTSHTPLVGAFSRYGWHHPGPWPFYLLSVPYRLVGAAHGLLVGAALWNLVTLVALAALLWTTDRGLALMALPMLALLVHTLGAGFLNDPWNPSLPVLSIALLVAVAHRHALGARWSGPALFGLASLVVQSEVTWLPLAAAVVAAAVISRHVTTRKATLRVATNRFRLMPATLASIAVVALAWTPVVIDQATAHPGNLTLIARQTLHPSRRDPSFGLGGGAQHFAREMGVPAPWMGAHEAGYSPGLDRIAGTGRPADLLPLLGIAALAVGVATRRRDRSAQALLAVAFAGAVGALGSMASLRGTPYQWLLRGVWPIAAWVWIACLWAIGRGVAAALAERPALRRAAPALAGIALVALAALAVDTTWRGSLGQRQADDRARVAAQLAPAVVAAAKAAGGAFLWPGAITADETWGLIVALNRAGVPWTDDLDAANRAGMSLTIGFAQGPAGIEQARRDGQTILATTRFGWPGFPGSDVIAAV